MALEGISYINSSFQLVRAR